MQLEIITVIVDVEKKTITKSKSEWNGSHEKREGRKEKEVKRGKREDKAIGITIGIQKYDIN